MNTKTTSRNLLLSLVIGALPIAVGCGSAATDGEAQTTAQTAALSADGVIPASNPDPGAEATMERHHEGWFKRLDSDGDGRVALADLPERLRARMAEADTNKDGFVTKDEMHAAKSVMFSKMKAAMDTNHDGTVSAEERSAARVRFTEAHLMKHDTNGDQALTADEVGAEKWDHIKQADTNGDGRITTDEIAAGVASGMLGHFHGPKNFATPAENGAETTVL